MKCPECNSELKKVEVKVEDATTSAVSYQCKKCGYFAFEQESTKKVIEELKAKETPLNIKQKIVKISKDRLGIYFNRDVVRSLNLQSGRDVFVTVPDKDHIILNLKMK